MFCGIASSRLVAVWLSCARPSHGVKCAKQAPEGAIFATQVYYSHKKGTAQTIVGLQQPLLRSILNKQE